MRRARKSRYSKIYPALLEWAVQGTTMFLVFCPACSGTYYDVRTQTLAYLHFQQRNRLRCEFYAPGLRLAVPSHTCRSAHTSPSPRRTAVKPIPHELSYGQEARQRPGSDRRGQVVQIQLCIGCATKGLSLYVIMQRKRFGA